MSHLNTLESGYSLCLVRVGKQSQRGCSQGLRIIQIRKCHFAFKIWADVCVSGSQRK